MGSNISRPCFFSRRVATIQAATIWVATDDDEINCEMDKTPGTTKPFSAPLSGIAKTPLMTPKVSAKPASASVKPNLDGAGGNAAAALNLSPIVETEEVVSKTSVNIKDLSPSFRRTGDLKHRVTLSVEVEVGFIDYEGGVNSKTGRRLQREYFFISYRLPDGQTIKSDVLSINKTTWFAYHDVTVDLNFLREFYKSSIQFILYRINKPTGTTPQVNGQMGMFGEDAVDTNGEPIATGKPDLSVPLDQQPAEVRKRFIEMLKTKSAKIRHNITILYARTQPKPHHYDIPEQTIVRSKGNNQLKKSTSSELVWDVTPIVDKSKTNSQSVETLDDIPYERSKSPPLPHHFDLPEKHHQESHPRVHTPPKKKAISLAAQGPAPHHWEMPDKILGTKRKKVAEVYEFIGKVGVDSQEMLLGATIDEVGFDKPHIYVDCLIIKLRLDKKIMTPEQQDALNAMKMTIQRVDDLPLDPMSLDQLKEHFEKPYITFRFIDGQVLRTHAIEHGSTLIFNSEHLIFMADQNKRKVLIQPIEFQVHHRDMGDDRATFGFVNVSLVDIVMSQTISKKYSVELRPKTGRIPAGSYTICKPSLKVLFELTKPIEVNKREVEAIINGLGRLGLTLEGLFTKFADGGDFNRAIVWCMTREAVEKLLFIVREFNMKLLKFDCYNPEHIKIFGQYKLSPNQRANTQFISGLAVHCGVNEAYVFLEGENLSIIEDVRLAECRILKPDRGFDKRQFPALEPLLYSVHLKRDITNMMYDNRLYMADNQYALEALTQLYTIFKIHQKSIEEEIKSKKPDPVVDLKTVLAELSKKPEPAKLQSQQSKPATAMDPRYKPAAATAGTDARLKTAGKKGELGSNATIKYTAARKSDLQHQTAVRPGSATGVRPGTGKKDSKPNSGNNSANNTPAMSRRNLAVNQSNSGQDPARAKTPVTEPGKSPALSRKTEPTANEKTKTPGQARRQSNASVVAPPPRRAPATTPKKDEQPVENQVPEQKDDAPPAKILTEEEILELVRKQSGVSVQTIDQDLFLKKAHYDAILDFATKYNSMQIVVHRKRVQSVKRHDTMRDHETKVVSL